jgi:hypothetical protein
LKCDKVGQGHPETSRLVSRGLASTIASRSLTGSLGGRQLAGADS